MGDDYNLWDRTEVWGQIKPFKLIWDTNPQLVDTIAQIGKIILKGLLGTP